MKKKVFISLGVGTAAIAAIILANSGMSERERNAFDEIKHTESEIEAVFNKISDVERIEKSLLNETLFKESADEGNKYEELLAKFNERQKEFAVLQKNIDEYQLEFQEIEKINGSTFLNKEVKMLGEEYLKVLNARFEILNKIEGIYLKILKSENDFYLDVFEKDSETISTEILKINELYIELEREQNNYNEKLKELKKYRAKYVKEFKYKE